MAWTSTFSEVEEDSAVMCFLAIFPTLYVVFLYNYYGSVALLIFVVVVVKLFCFLVNFE